MSAPASRPTVLLLDPRDTVAVAVSPLQPGTEITVTRGAEALRIVADALIPFGHKIALVPMDEGGQVIKYGEVVGIATSPIRPGQHVHVHNVRSDRAGTGRA